MSCRGHEEYVGAQAAGTPEHLAYYEAHAGCGLPESHIVVTPCCALNQAVVHRGSGVLPMVGDCLLDRLCWRFKGLGSGPGQWACEQQYAGQWACEQHCASQVVCPWP